MVLYYRRYNYLQIVKRLSLTFHAVPIFGGFMYLPSAESRRTLTSIRTFFAQLATCCKAASASCFAHIEKFWLDCLRRRQAVLQKIAADLTNKRAEVTASWTKVNRAWQDNQHFTLLFIPANGRNVAKKHVARKHLQRSFICAGALLAVLIGGFGFTAKQAILTAEEKRELAEFKQVKQAQEETIRRLEQMAEKNQQELAQIHKLEEEMRKQMAKSGISLPPKTDSAASAQGGPV